MIRLFVLSLLLSEEQTEPDPHCQTQPCGVQQLPGFDGGVHGIYRHGAGSVGVVVLSAPPFPPQAKGEACQPGD